MARLFTAIPRPRWQRCCRTSFRTELDECLLKAFTLRATEAAYRPNGRRPVLRTIKGGQPGGRGMRLTSRLSIINPCSSNLTWPASNPHNRPAFRMGVVDDVARRAVDEKILLLDAKGECQFGRGHPQLRELCSQRLADRPRRHQTSQR